jgi:hypothetical protein
LLADDPAEQAVLVRIKALIESGMGSVEIANLLNAEKIAPPQGPIWTIRLLYGLKVREGWHVGKKVNVRQHSDEEVKIRMRELRDVGTSLKSTANILNEEGYIPYKGKKFTEPMVCKLLGGIRDNKLLTPKAFCESLITRADGVRPSYPALARMLQQSGFQTPKGNTNWWPAQVQQLLGGAYDAHYRSGRQASDGARA